ncbi:MAG: cytidylate kinase family protein [Clostridium sp.]|nr:cytidylate kinase family protein [Clostridium sp.]
MENNQYLGTEKVGRLLRQFAIPCIFSLIISCLYNIVDQIFVGNGVGYLGNAATGVIFPITVVGWGMSLFFGDGAAAHLSVALGRSETESIHRGVGNAILCSFLSGVVIIAIGYLGGSHLLRLIGATDANLSMAHDYGFIIYIMMPLAMVQNTLASIIRADGSPRYAMGAMLVGAVINIIGDPVAIFVLDLGIRGAAYATIFGQFVSFVICAVYLRKSRTFRICAGSFRLDGTLLKKIMALGTSSLLTQLSIVIITVINNILLVRYGAESVYEADIPLAAFVVIMKLFQIVLNIAIGIAAGAQPIVGYNYGAGKYGRVRELYLSMNAVRDAITAQDQAIRSIADKGSCVIVGRSADHVLRNHSNIVRIFITAPKAYRVEKIMEMYKDSREQAQKSMERSDAARKAYYESITGKRWGDSHGYELCLDSSIGIEQTADLIVSYVRAVCPQ